MTSISILGGDFEILLDDELNQNGGTLAVTGMRTVQKAVATPTAVTTRALYSAVADAMDDFVAMGFTNAMLPTTPNAFTMENFYFIPRSTTEFLSEGAITATWGMSASPDTNGNGVLKVAYTGGTNFVANEIGRNIIQADTSDSGTLLDFDIDPDGTLIAWIRPTDSTPGTGDTFDGTGALSVVADGGAGVSTSSTAGISGSTQWAAIQAIGSVPTATDVYLYQDRIKINSSDGTFQWWTTDATANLGIISILIQTISSGVTIADGDVEVFARRYTSLYDNFRLNVSAGGFSALPLASAPDINNTTGYQTETVIDSSGTGTFVVGEVINEAVSLAKGVITAVAGTSANPIIDYYLVGDTTVDIFSSGAQTVTGATSGATLLSLAPTATVGGPTETGAGNGGSVTVALGGFLVDHDGDGNNEPYSIQVDAQGDVVIADVYERIKYICSRGQTADLITGMNVPGESYRGLDGLVEYDGAVGTLIEGDDIVTTTGGNTWTARLLNQNTTGAALTPTYVTYITVTDQQTSVDSLANNDSIQDEALDTDVVIVRSDGTIGTENFTSPKSSPLGTFTGTQIFGARGVHFLNLAGADTQAYILTDDRGTLNNPPNTITFTVSGTLALDRVLVARDTGVDGIIDKDQFGGLTTGVLDASTITVTGTVDTEVPASGYVRVVENALRQEHHYVYDSRTTGASGVFTLRVVNEGTSATSASTTQLIDTGATFQTAPVVEVGMLVRNVFAGKTTHVWEVTNIVSTTTLDVAPLYGPGGAAQDWDIGDTYSINKLIGDHTVPASYAVTDDLYDLIIDAEATTTTINNQFIKATGADFDVVVNVRQGKIILPFTQNQLQQDDSVTVTVVRQPDTIAQ